LVQRTIIALNGDRPPQFIWNSRKPDRGSLALATAVILYALSLQWRRPHLAGCDFAKRNGEDAREPLRCLQLL
jgi:hypothetical protein